MNESDALLQHEILSQPSYEKAVDILRAMYEKLGPEKVAYFITPNVILTLSGARAYCDGVYKHDDPEVLNAWIRDINDGIDVIRNTVDIPYANAGIDESLSGGKYAGYGILSLDGLQYSLNQTRFLDDTDSIVDQKLTGQDLYDALEERLRKNPNLSELDDEGVSYFVQGILLGYPDTSIESTVGKWNPDELSDEEKLIDAKIEGARFYHCPLPIYEYPIKLRGDESLVAHERLWSEILTGFYESDFHQKLSQDPSFQAKAHELGLFEKKLTT